MTTDTRTYEDLLAFRRAVALEVLGYTDGHTYWAGGQMQAAWRANGEDWYHDFPPFGLTADGMLLVLERMRELGWFVYIEEGDTTDDGSSRPWEVHYRRFVAFLPGSGSVWPVGEWEDVDASADTLPEAVALAALAAVRTQS